MTIVKFEVVSIHWDLNENQLYNLYNIYMCIEILYVCYFLLNGPQSRFEISLYFSVNAKIHCPIN